ncbi:hypothetical protein N0V90_012012 [Kalmusia sp. IMI 367209]|nr:hypothetical protein N0V90_012012 [Kalmusia sp. IMI 367209]
MRLLQRLSDGEFELSSWTYNTPNYAILSHTWGKEDEEVTFKDLIKGKARFKPYGYRKLQFCSEQAEKDGLHYFWVDTCCIDKSSSEELSEALNSMFNWYCRAKSCYVYLIDVYANASEMKSQQSPDSWQSAFRQSRWFTRGWTLQELLAPKTVEFFSVQGVKLGDKKSLELEIHEITKIPREALPGDALESFTIAERISWAKNRTTERVEDKAYSLLGICKVFMPPIYGEEDNAWTRLQEELHRRYAEDTKFEQLLAILPVASQAAFNSYNNQHGPTCLPNTRVEVLQEITDWIDGLDKKWIYWLNGIAGTGKSTIARTIARKYHDAGRLGASFFFAKGGGDVGQADRFVTTLAHQLATRLPWTKRHICEAIMKNSDITQQSLRDQWDRLIIEPLSRVDYSSAPETAVIVVDALDECGSDSDIRLILRLLATTRRVVEKIRVRIFVTSRPETPLRSGFAHIPKAERQIFALHGIQPTLIDRDLSVFFEQHLRDVRDERGFGTGWPGQRIIKRLVEISSGLFIWAATACRFIADGKVFAMRRINLLVNGQHPNQGPQKQLDGIYTTVLKDAVEHYNMTEKNELYPRLREVLGSIILLFSPLTASSLTNLLGLPSGHIDQMLRDLHTIFPIPEHNDRPIRLHHPTFRDFILDQTRCSDPNFRVDGKEAHKTLADRCISIMSKMLRQDICNLKLPGTRTRDVDARQIEQCIPSELQYACLYWAEHYRQSGYHLCDGDHVHIFLQEYYLHWLEAVNLMGKSVEVVAIVRMYHSILKPELNREQIPWIKDARRLLFIFQSIIKETPLQVYCAALVFIKPTNTLQGHFKVQLHPWIKEFRICPAIAPEPKDEYNYFNDVVFTPDGRQVASGSTNEVVRIWDVATKAARGTFEGQRDKVSSLDISPDGTLLVAGSDDNTVMVWDMQTRAVRHVLRDHSRWVCSAIFSPSGRQIASCSMDETIILWDTQTGRNLQTFDNHSSCVNSIAFSPDGSMIVSGSVDEIIRIWSISEAKIHLTIYGHTGTINSVRYSPNGKCIISGSDDMTIKIWDTYTGAELGTLKGHTRKVTAVAYSPDGGLIASGSEDKTVMLWGAKAGTALGTLKGHMSGINAVTFSPDGLLLASGAFNDEVRLWDVRTGESRGEFDEFTADGQIEPAASSGIRQSLQMTEANASLAETDGLRAHSARITSLSISIDGRLLSSGSEDASIKLWRKGFQEQLRLDGHLESINRLVFSPDNLMLASASEDGTVKLWDTATGQLIYTLRGHSGTVLQLRFFSSPDFPCLLASCSNDKTAQLYDTRTGELLSTLVKHEDTVVDVAFCPNAHLIATCSADKTINLWSLEADVTHRVTLAGHTDVVSSIVFTTDGKEIVSCSVDGTIKLWTTAGVFLGNLKNLRNDRVPTNSVALSQDNKYVVASLLDQKLQRWNKVTRLPDSELFVGAQVRAIAFSSCGKYIQTDRGTVDAEALSTSSVSTQSQSLFAAQEWLKYGMIDALWLPDEFHACSVAVWERTIVMGHPSGGITFIRF